MFFYVLNLNLPDLPDPPILPPQADWTREITTNQCLNGVALTKWAVVYIGKNSEPVKNFVALMIKLAPKMGIRVAQPAMVELPNDRTETYVKVNHVHLCFDFVILVSCRVSVTVWIPAYS